MFDHARAQESEDARRECPTTSALTHFRERSRDSWLIADFCRCSSGSMHALKTMWNEIQAYVFSMGDLLLLAITCVCRYTGRRVQRGIYFC